MRPAFEHRQREDIHLHMVLVHPPRNPPDLTDNLQSCDSHLPVCQASTPQGTQQDGTSGSGRGVVQKDERRRLVDTLHALQEHGSSHIQGRRLGTGQENRIGEKQQSVGTRSWTVQEASNNIKILLTNLSIVKYCLKAQLFVLN